MPYYIYEALDQSTHKFVEGRIEALNLREAKEVLRTQGQIPTSLNEDHSVGQVTSMIEEIPIIGELVSGTVKLKDVNIMTQQLYVLLDAGIPLIEGLFLLEQQTENKKLKAILKQVRSDVIAGESFSAALAKHPKVFSRLYINMMKSGEVSGEMDSICARLADLLEKLMILQGKVVGALVYPAVTVFIVIAVVAIIMIFVIPMFSSFFAGFGAELPAPTRALIAISDFLSNPVVLVTLILCGAGFGFWFEVFRRGEGKPFVDQWLLTMPLIGDVLRKVYVSRFVRTLGTVIGAGVSLTEALATASGTVDNYVLRTAFEKAKDSLLQGGTLSRPLEKSEVFPVMVVKMIAIGEETGQMEEMLNKSADFLDQEVDRSVETLTTLIEPIMIVVIGAIVGGIAVAIYLPIFELSSTIN